MPRFLFPSFNIPPNCFIKDTIKNEVFRIINSMIYNKLTRFIADINFKKTFLIISYFYIIRKLNMCCYFGFFSVEANTTFEKFIIIFRKTEKFFKII